MALQTKPFKNQVTSNLNAFMAQNDERKLAMWHNLQSFSIPNRLTWLICVRLGVNQCALKILLKKEKTTTKLSTNSCNLITEFKEC